MQKFNANSIETAELVKFLMLIRLNLQIFNANAKF